MNTESRISEARGLLTSGLPMAAADMLEELIEDQPCNHKALHLIGRAYLLLKDPEKAAFYLRRSLDLQRAPTQEIAAPEFGTADEEYANEIEFAEADYVPGEEYETPEGVAVAGADPLKVEGGVASNVSQNNEVADEVEVDDEGWLEFDSTLVEPSADDWEHVLLEEGFTDPEEEILDYEEIVYSGRISQQDRARQIVAGLASEYALDEELFEALVEVIAFHKCHGQTKLAMRRLLEEGIAAQELKTVFSLRDYWRGYEGFSRCYYSPEPVAAYLNLGWSLGLAIIQYLGSDDLEVAERFLEDCFEDWQSSARLIQGFNSFRIYLVHLMEHAFWCAPDLPPAYVDHQFFDNTEELAVDLPGSTVYRWLEENNLVAREPVPWYPPIKRKEAETDEANDPEDETEA